MTNLNAILRTDFGAFLDKCFRHLNPGERVLRCEMKVRFRLFTAESCRSATGHYPTGSFRGGKCGSGRSPPLSTSEPAICAHSILLGHTKPESTVRYLSIEVDHPLVLAE